ncbi:MAG: snoK, partial [Pseudomonadota bacterium]
MHNPTPSTSPSELTDVSKPWESDNQAWWDWYVSLADNDGEITDFESAPPLPDIDLPGEATIFAELAEPYPLTEANIAFFRDNGFIKLKEVFSPGAVLRLRAELVRLLSAKFETDIDGGVQDRFLSLEMV